MKIVALFADYDGTLAPRSVSRDESRVPDRLQAILRSIAAKIPFCIISSKDLGFLQERIPFAHAIAAINGMELKIGKETFVSKKFSERRPQIEGVFKRVENVVRSISERIIVERKNLSNGETVALSIDWRLCGEQSNYMRPRLNGIIASLKELGLHISEFSELPWIDVYPLKIDKGEGFEMVKERLGVSGPVLYLGDTEADDPAFKLAEVSVGVIQERPMRLASDFVINFSDLPKFLEDLLSNDFAFDEKMFGLKKIGEVNSDF